MTFERSITIPTRKLSHTEPSFSIAAYEDSVVSHLTKILQSDQHSVVISSAKWVLLYVFSFPYVFAVVKPCEAFTKKIWLLVCYSIFVVGSSDWYAGWTSVWQADWLNGNWAYDNTLSMCLCMSSCITFEMVINQKNAKFLYIAEFCVRQ
jgi:hypothetical protein